MGAEVMAWAGRQKVGDIAAKLVLMALGNCCDDKTGECFPSMDFIMDYAECGRDYAKRKLRFLEKEGWIAREARFAPNGRQTSNLYKINLDKGVSFDEWRKSRDKKKGVTRVPPTQGLPESPLVRGPESPVEGCLSSPPLVSKNEYCALTRADKSLSRKGKRGCNPPAPPEPQCPQKRREIGEMMKSLAASLNVSKRNPFDRPN